MIEFATVLSVVNALAILSCLFWLRHYAPAYLTEKGKNLATKEDISTITDEVERIRNQYLSEIERLKQELLVESHLLEKRRALFEQMASSLRIFIAGHQAVPEQKEQFTRSYAASWLWAPDGVVTALNMFLDLQVKHAASPGSVPQPVMKLAYTQVLLEVRKGVGFSTTALNPSDYKFVQF